MRLTQIYVGLSALLFLGFGAVFLARPELLAAVDMAPQTPTAFADARADYGGCAFGIGLFLALATFRPTWFTPALWCIGLTLGGYAAGRILSLFIDGTPRPIIYTLIAFELTGSLMAFLMLRLKK